MSSDNAAIKDETMQDMTRPLPEYYISSSHNVRSIDASVYRNDVVLMRCSIDRRTSLAANSKARVLSRDTFELCSKGADASNVRCPVNLLAFSFTRLTRGFVSSRRMGWRRWRSSRHSWPHPHFEDSCSNRLTSYRSIRLSRFAFPSHPQCRSSL